MKKIFFVRHAKSDWSYGELGDFERPLNKRGKRDAPFMANLLYEKKVMPDLIISSPALRAYFTARIFAQTLNYPLEKIECTERLYDSSAGTYLEIINNLEEEISTVIIFGHNLELTTTVNMLGDKTISNVPTTGIVEIDFDVPAWKEIKPGNGQTVSFEFPKKYFK